jgi:hypothetical protein
MAAAASLPQLRLASRIKYQKLKRTDDEALCICGLCALPGDMVLLACGSDPYPCRVRAFSLGTNLLYPHDVCALEGVRRVAYHALSDTLLCVCVDNNDRGNDNSTCIVSLRRGAGETTWLEVNRLPTPMTWNEIGELVVCDSRVLLAQHSGDTHRLHVFDVNEQNVLSAAGNIDSEARFKCFACVKVGADILIAFAHETTVSLRRLRAFQLDLLDSFDFTEPVKLLFRGDLLLVADVNKANDTHAIMPLLTTGGRFTRLSHMLLDANNDIGIEKWCLESDRLFVWDWVSFDLLEFALIKN